MSAPTYQLLGNVHLALESPVGEMHLTRHEYFYHHYKCDGFDDVGWGCAYRTLQTMCSMLKLVTGKNDVQIPSIPQIQEILVRIGDKESSFKGSNEWLGSVETCYVIDELFDVPCQMHHISAEQNISCKQKEIVDYFKNQGGLIAMGGEQDAGSKLIAGAHVSSDDELSLLVVDPHFVGKPKSAEDLVSRGYVKWQSDFIENSFYNLCMPKIFSINK